MVQEVLRGLRRHLAHAAGKLGLFYRGPSFIAAWAFWEGKDKITKGCQLKDVKHCVATKFRQSLCRTDEFLITSGSLGIGNVTILHCISHIM